MSIHIFKAQKDFLDNKMDIFGAFVNFNS